MLRYPQPNKVIEVGSGYSSALVLDVNTKYFANKLDLTFAEPFPKLLEELVNDNDARKINAIESPIQDVPVDLFAKLDRNDILFIDSTHIVKTHSDVVFEINEILPVLKPGVIIHFHDIFYPFEYPSHWIYRENRSWNE